MIHEVLRRTWTLELIDPPNRRCLMENTLSGQQIKRSFPETGELSFDIFCIDCIIIYNIIDIQLILDLVLVDKNLIIV